MASINLATLLGVLPTVGPVIAAAPAFAQLFTEAIGALKHPQDQDVAKQAYDLAISDARTAHTELQDLVARHS